MGPRMLCTSAQDSRGGQQPAFPLACKVGGTRLSEASRLAGSQESSPALCVLGARPWLQGLFRLSTLSQNIFLLSLLLATSLILRWPHS